jgi:hypothetical protein
MKLSVSDVVLVCPACRARRPVLLDADVSHEVVSCLFCATSRWMVAPATARDRHVAHTVVDLLRIAPGEIAPPTTLSRAVVARYRSYYEKDVKVMIGFRTAVSEGGKFYDVDYREAP